MPTPWLAPAVLVGALAIHAELLTRLRRVDSPMPPWWFGYARDGTNLSAALMQWGAFLLIGFPSPVAFLAACLTALGTYFFDWLFARALRVRRRRLAIAVPLLAWVVIVAARPALVERALSTLIAHVEPAR